MNTPLAKLTLSSTGEVRHTLLAKPNPQSSPKTPLDLYDYWGMQNFATVRIVPRSLVEAKRDLPYSLPKENFYLELSHHPSVLKATVGHDYYLRKYPKVHIDKSYIPLSEEHMKRLWDHMYTGRFILEEGLLRRYGVSLKEAKQSTVAPKLNEKIPSGSYEFTNGTLFSVKAQGITSKVSKDHPLATFDPQHCFLFFNAGIECDTRFLPQLQDRGLSPARYGYFRDGALYIMGAPLFAKDDPALLSFIENEEKRRSSTYAPFIDLGPPLHSDGSLDIEKIKQFGLQVPHHHYLALGDNHAVSADSRDFGFVPQGNLRGVPSFMFWAPNDRFGFPNHGIYPFFTLARLLIYLELAIIFLIWRYYDRRLYDLRHLTQEPL